MEAESTRNWMELLPLIVFMAVMLVMFYYMVLVPTKRRQKTHQDLVAGIKEGDEIITAGGIYGKVVKLREETVDIEVAQGVRLKLDRRALRRKAGEREP